MPFETPQYPEIRERILADLQNALGLGPSPRRSIIAALAGALAGAAQGAHGFNQWVSRQVMPDTAEASNLERWASIFGVARKPSTFAAGQVGIKGSLLTPNAVVPIGTIIQAGPLRFQAIGEGVMVDGFAETLVEALEPGAAYNLPEGEKVYLPTPLPDLLSSGHVDAPGITGGTDPETDESLRERLLLRLQEPPRGGVAADYVAWALEVPGVTRAWALPLHAGIGTVGLTFMRDGEGDGVPTQQQVDEVAAYVGTQMPIGAQLVAFIPGVLEVDFELSITPDTPSLRAAVEASLSDLLDRESKPSGSILLSHVHEVISTTPGEQDHVLVTPNANIAIGAGQIARLGEVTWS